MLHTWAYEPANPSHMFCALVGLVLLVRLGRAQLHCTGLSMSCEHAGQIHKRETIGMHGHSSV